MPPADDKTKSSYVKALINEIALSEAGLDKNVTSIFIGGGTPSAINAEYIKDILEAVKQRYRVDGNAEITIECNPGTINSEKAYIYREAGINRISFGLQSTDDKELRMLGRIHTFEQFKNSLAIARNAGFTNINIDLMSALPGQTIESFTRVLKEAVSASCGSAASTFRECSSQYRCTPSIWYSLTQYLTHSRIYAVLTPSKKNSITTSIPLLCRHFTIFLNSVV